jgi:hypothetical protein
VPESPGLGAAGASSGKMVASKFRSTGSNCSGGTSAVGSLGRPSTSMLFCFAYSRIPWNRVLPSGDGPRLGISRRVEGEDVGERPGGSVSCGERVAKAPLLPERGDQGGMPVLLVEHLAFGHPRRHDDGRDPVARAVEPEAVLSNRGGRIRWRHGRRRNVVVGASGFVPADQQGRVPHVGPCRGLHSPVRVVDP